MAYLDTALGILWAGDIGTAVLETVALHADYAKNAAKHITAGTVYKVSCSDQALKYQCKDLNNVNDAIAGLDGKQLTDEKNKGAPFDGTATQIFDYEEIMDGNVVLISNPGIYNSKEAAFRNAIKQNPEAAANGYLYVVLNNPTVEAIPGLGEVVNYAFYDKINEWLGGRLPLSNAEKTNAILRKLAKETNTTILTSDHSRGSMTEKVAMAYLQNVLGITGIPIESTKFLGPAAYAPGYIKLLEKNGYVDEYGIGSSFFMANHNTDFVGRLVGFNFATAGTCIGNPFGSCYSHSSYNGAYYLEEYLTDPFGKNYIDQYTKNPIPNPEFKNIEEAVQKIYEDENGLFPNPTLARLMFIGKDGNIRVVDRLGNMTTVNRITQKVIGTTQIPIHEINGRRYFNFEGKKYYADPNH